MAVTEVSGALARLCYMGRRTAIADALTRATQPLGLVVEEQTSWDRMFKRWIADAKRNGQDPNDIGDRDWGSDLLDVGLQSHYRPHRDWTVLEMGPGTGRLTRHLIGKCEKLVLVDTSNAVVQWLDGYLRGKGSFEAYQIDGPRFPVAAHTADAVFAHGVVEHLPAEELYWYLHEFRRVLKPTGIAVFNFNNLASHQGAELITARYQPLTRISFRLHMPETIQRLAKLAGFAEARIQWTGTRVAFGELRAAERLDVGEEVALAGASFGRDADDRVG